MPLGTHMCLVGADNARNGLASQCPWAAAPQTPDWTNSSHFARIFLVLALKMPYLSQSLILRPISIDVPVKTNFMVT